SPQLRDPSAGGRRLPAPDQPILGPRVAAHHRHLHPSDRDQRGPHPGRSGYSLPASQILIAPACDRTGRSLAPALAGVRGEVWRPVIAFASTRRRRHCLLPHSRAGRPTVPLRLRPVPLCLSLLQPSGLSAVWPRRYHRVAGPTTSPTLASALLSGHLHRPRTVARSD